MRSEVVLSPSDLDPCLFIEYLNFGTDYANEFLIIRYTIQDLGCYPIDTSIAIKDSIGLSVGAGSGTTIEMRTTVWP